jgi:hypothetical protein
MARARNVSARDQPLLDAVVEVTLDASASLVGRGDDPSA